MSVNSLWESFCVYFMEISSICSSPSKLLQTALQRVPQLPPEPVLLVSPSTENLQLGSSASAFVSSPSGFYFGPPQVKLAEQQQRRLIQHISQHPLKRRHGGPPQASQVLIVSPVQSGDLATSRPPSHVLSSSVRGSCRCLIVSSGQDSPFSRRAWRRM